MAVLTDMPAELIREILHIILSSPTHEFRPSVYAFARAIPHFESITASLLKEGRHRWFDNPNKTYIPSTMPLEAFARVTRSEIERLRAAGTHLADCVATIDRLRLCIHQSTDDKIERRDIEKIVMNYNGQGNVLLQIKRELEFWFVWELRKIT